MGKKQGAYLYGITAMQVGEVDCPGIGTPPQKVHLVPAGGVGLIITHLSPDFEDVSIEDAVQHVRVLENVMAKSPVLPIRFGTVAESLADLKRMVASHEFVIRKELNRLKGKYEVGVKAYWRKEVILEELQQSKDYSTLVEQAQQDSRTAIELGQRIESIANEWRSKFEEQFHPELARLTTDSIVGEAMGVEMVYNGSFLVTPEQDQRLKEKVVDIAEKKLASKIEFHYTTNLPPYNFVKLKLHWG
ncbi:gas vesicle protein GvpL/GvpF [Hydrogenispora ethanolica]|jgi:hypothetical protein|uniref:Gas vesicle protein GvpL/GvpF n=1 Tax=Hydrogenispora ethanolica TaxID=1082276 RepID=A0A4R1QXP3_HYDET|nr:GvpL/GvpF family gas vesicle protein [Hydrogenispora ethanolica]TCL56794.1 gas vesicle protein GvpL/GvpF [Hydrogenispora ethanolica]